MTIKMWCWFIDPFHLIDEKIKNDIKSYKIVWIESDEGGGEEKEK